MAQHTDASHDEVQELTQQFYVTLRAYVARLSPQDEARSAKSFTQIQELLNGGHDVWSDAYQIEQLMVDLFDERTLEIELQTRLLESESNLRPAMTAQYVKLAGALKTPAERRALLARVVNDLQWRYTVNEVKRTYSKEITKITGLIFIVALVFFAAMVAVIALVPPDEAKIGDATLLLLAGLAGAWGAAFSMLSGLKGRLEAADLNDLKVMRSGWIIWSRPLIGVGAAAILYFFMASGLLGGTAFPTLDARSRIIAAADQSAAPANTPPLRSEQSTRTQIALLIVWCFIAGFSERLVPALLAKTEDRASGQAVAGPDRFKPSAAPTGDSGPTIDKTVESKPSASMASPPAADAAPQA